jgi:hypothetical protein
LYIGLVPGLNRFDRSSAAVVFAVLLLALRLLRASAAEWDDPSNPAVRLIELEQEIKLELVEGRDSGNLILRTGHGDTGHVFEDFGPSLTDGDSVSGVTPGGFGASRQRQLKYDLARAPETMKLERVHLTDHSKAGDGMSRFALTYPDNLGTLVYLHAACNRVEGQLAESKSRKPPPSQPTALDSGVPSRKSTYTNEKYGISLQYPSNYTLKEGELGNEYTLGYLGPIPMKFTAAGGVRVVTVALPPNSYPGTDFNTAFVTLSVNQHLTRDECEDFPDGLPGSGKPIRKRFSGIKFHGSKQSDGGLGHQFGGFYYHGFSAGSCYELGDGIAISGYGAVDGMKKVDERQVFAILDKILESVTIHPPKLAWSPFHY